MVLKNIVLKNIVLKNIVLKNIYCFIYSSQKIIAFWRSPRAYKVLMSQMYGRPYEKCHSITLNYLLTH